MQAAEISAILGNPGGSMSVMKCETCGVTEQFQTKYGVEYFKLLHDGHSLTRVGKGAERDEVEALLEEVERADGPLGGEEKTEVAKLEPQKTSGQSYQVNERKGNSEPAEPKAAPKQEEARDPPKELAQDPPAKPPRSRKAEPVRIPPRKTTETEATLLLSRSSYIQDGEIRKRDAAKVSRILQDFRWTIQPPYTIGVMFDDIMSIRSSIGIMSKNLIEGVEGQEYTLVAVSVDGGEPVAWFKRTPERSAKPDSRQGHQRAKRSAEVELFWVPTRLNGGKGHGIEKGTQLHGSDGSRNGTAAPAPSN